MSAAARIFVLTRDDNDREEWQGVFAIAGHWSPGAALQTFFHDEDPEAGTYRCESPNGHATLTWDGDKVVAA